MSKLDDIRRMREANYDRQKSHSNAEHRSERPQLSPAPDRSAGEIQDTPFNRAAYQREYMRKWRAKRTEELKRLRELVGEK